MRRHAISPGTLFMVGISLFAPTSAIAACKPGGTPTYQDVTGIAVRRCGTVGFIYDTWVTSDGYLVFHGVDNTPVKGYYDGYDGRVLFAKLLRTLQDEDFFSIRLKPSPTLYVDGFCETIHVMRCGVVTSVGGLSAGVLPFEADLKDAQTLRFDALVSKMQTAIFAWPWNNEHAYPPTPAPSRTDADSRQFRFGFAQGEMGPR